MKYVKHGLIVLCCAFVMHAHGQNSKVFQLGSQTSLFFNNHIYVASYANDFNMSCLDTSGNILWQRSYGGSDNDWPWHIYHVNEYGDDYLLWIGNTLSFESGFPPFHYKGYVIKTNLLGDTVWSRVYDRAVDISFCLANDSNYIFSLYTSYGDIMKVDRITGDTLWTRKNIWNVGPDVGLNINWGEIYNSGDGFYVSGTTYPVSNAKIKLMKTDTLGRALWIKAYGDSIPNIGEGLFPCSNGDFILIGGTASASNQGDTLSYQDINILRVSPSGDTVWTRRYCHLNWPDRPGMVIQDNNDFIIACKTRDRQLARNYLLVFKIDSIGNVLWSKKYPGSYPHSLQKTASGYLVDDGFIHLIDNSGNDCTAEPAPITVAHSMITIDSIVPYDSSGLEFYMSPPTQEFTSTIPVTDYCLFLNGPSTEFQEQKFSVYPNPANEDVIIYRDEKMFGFNNLSLYDTFGRLILKQVLPDEGKVLLSLAHFRNGFYFLKLSDEQENSRTEKLLIQQE